MYVCARVMKIQKADGSIDIRKPGDEVPEAKDWHNLAMWVRRGYIRPIDRVVIPGMDRTKLAPMVETVLHDSDPKTTEPKITLDTETVKQPKAEPKMPILADEKHKQIGELLELSRTELNNIAGEEGIEDVKKMPNKTEVARAIVDKRLLK